jgi:hypothetical protein
MRKIRFLIILCTLGIAGIANAQQQVSKNEARNAAKGIKLNINAGFYFSNMIGKDVQKDDNLFLGVHSEDGYLKYYDDYNLNAGGYKGLLPGYKFGFGITFDVTKYFACGVDLNFQTKGCLIPMKELIVSYYNTTTYPIYTSDIEVKRFPASNFHSKIKLNYIVIPIRAEFKYKKFYFTSGLYTGFLLNAVNTAKFDYEDRSFDLRYTLTGYYSPIDFGILLNTGFCFPFLEKHFIKIGLVGEWNINGIRNNRIHDGGRNSYFVNQVFGLELKYEIKIK